jgi:hypothetical protein
MAVLAIVGFCGMAYGKDKAPGAEKPKAEKPLVGELTDITPSAPADGTGKLTVKSGKKTEATETKVDYNKDTKVTIDGADKTIGDLAKGMKVSITPATGTAKEIKAITPKPKAPKAAK